MQAYVDLPAPNGLDDDIVGRAIYELNKLGTIESGPYGALPVEVYTLPADSTLPKFGDAPVLRLVANLIPYVR